MTARSLEFHPLAFLEAVEAYEWYAQQNPEAANRFLNGLDDAIDKILEGPEHWPIYEEGVRWLLIRKYPYVVFYDLRGSLIRVIAVAHASREPDYWTDRL